MCVCVSLSLPLSLSFHRSHGMLAVQVPGPDPHCVLIEQGPLAADGRRLLHRGPGALRVQHQAAPWTRGRRLRRTLLPLARGLPRALLLHPECQHCPVRAYFKWRERDVYVGVWGYRFLRRRLDCHLHDCPACPRLSSSLRKPLVHCCKRSAVGSDRGDPRVKKQRPANPHAHCICLHYVDVESC